MFVVTPTNKIKYNKIAYDLAVHKDDCKWTKAEAKLFAREISKALHQADPITFIAKCNTAMDMDIQSAVEYVGGKWEL